MTAADLRHPPLERLSPHFYRLGPYTITNHPRLIPRSWVVTRNGGHHVSEHGTLRAAVESLGGAA